MSILEQILGTVTGDILEGVLEPFNYFIFTVKTDNAGTSLSDQFTVPTVSAGTYDAYVDWGDGSDIENITTYNDARWTHTFAGGAGTYEVKIWGTFVGWVFDDGGDDDKILDIKQWGIYSVEGDIQKAFRGCSNLVVTATDVPIGTVTNLFRAFQDCNITSIPSFLSWDLTQLISLNNTFSGTPLNQDLSTLYAPLVFNLTAMLKNTNVDFSVGSWVWSNVTTATDFMDGVTLSTANYDDSLIGIESQSLQSGVSINFGLSKWGFGYGGQAKYDIISTYAWTIADNGQSDSTLGIWINAHNLLKSSVNPSDGALVPTWSDLTDYANDGTATGAQQPVFKTSIANGEPALLFDGVDDRLDIAAASEINDLFSSGGSVFVVFNATTEGEAIGRIFSKYSNTGDTNGGVLYLNDNGVGQGDLIYQKGFSTTNCIWRVENGVTYGNVVIVLMTYDASSASNDPVIYINSKTASTVSEDVTPVGTVLSDSTKALTIGNSEGTNRTFDGYIFEIAMWKKTLSSQEISDYFDYFAEKYGETLS